MHPAQNSTWKRVFFEGAKEVLDRGKKGKKGEAELEKERLLKTIDQQKVEIDL